MSNNGRVNLGQACFKTTDSLLQLQLTAIGHFKSPIDCPARNLEIESTQLSHILTAWVTEAPQLEIRLHIGINPRLEWTLSRLVSSLGERMSSSKIWSDLGFTIAFKSCETSEKIERSTGNRSFTSCLVFGLCRGTHSETGIVSRRVPSILRSPPNAHPPIDQLSVILSAIDVYLEYEFLEESETQVKEESDEICPPVDLLYDLELDYRHNYFQPPTKDCLSAKTNFVIEAETLNDLYDESLSGLLPQDNEAEETAHLLLCSYRLLENGLERLFLSSPTKSSQNIAFEENRRGLARISDLAPSIVNPFYRQAMEQRAVSIPIISKAISSMLESSQNPDLKSMAGRFLQSIDSPPIVPNLKHTHSSSSQKRLNRAIHLSLWRIAQTQLRGIKNGKKMCSFFSLAESNVMHTTDFGANMLLEPDSCSSLSNELLDSSCKLDLSQSTCHPQLETDIFIDDWTDEECVGINEGSSVFECIFDLDQTPSVNSTDTSPPRSKLSDSSKSYEDSPLYSQSPSSSSKSDITMLFSDEDEETDDPKGGSDLLVDF